MPREKPAPTIDALIEDALRGTARAPQVEALAEAARQLALPRLIEMARALHARTAWPTDIVAIEGQERNLFLTRRASVLGTTLASALNEHADAAADAALIDLVESADEAVSNCAQHVVIGRARVGEDTRVANAAVLTRLAAHLERNDPLAAAAAVAAVRLGERDIGARLAALDDGAPWFTVALHRFVQMSHEVVPLTSSLWDLYRRRLAHLAVLLSDELENRAPADVLVHALTTSPETDCDAAILAGLRKRLTKASAPLLAAALPALAGRGIASALEALVKKKAGRGTVAR